MKNLNNVKLNFKFEGQRAKNLKSRGVDGYLFAGSKNAFEFDVSAVRMKPEIPNIIVKGYSVKKQLNQLTRLLSNPLKGNPVIGIGSFPTDLRAKLVALNIMDAAITQQDKNRTRRSVNRDYPLWHKVYGTFYDKLRDLQRPDNTSMLIISNVDCDSTSPKIEKVRDLLELHSSVPRIVVISGTDPMGFFANRLHMPMDCGFYLGADNRENKTSVLDI
jgi:hypothetical protein